MTQNRLITITDIQRSDSGDERTEVITRGSLSGGPDDYTLCFKEMLDGENECLTRMTVRSKNCVTVLRTGAFNSELMIEEGHRHNCHYTTPYGDFMIGIFAKSVESRISTGGGQLKMHYTIDFFGGLAAEKIMVVDVSEKTQEKKPVRGKEKGGYIVSVKPRPPVENE